MVKVLRSKTTMVLLSYSDDVFEHLRVCRRRAPESLRVTHSVPPSWNVFWSLCCPVMLFLSRNSSLPSYNAPTGADFKTKKLGVGHVSPFLSPHPAYI
jgi:hypothetical protein